MLGGRPKTALCKEPERIECMRGLRTRTNRQQRCVGTAERYLRRQVSRRPRHARASACGFGAILRCETLGQLDAVRAGASPVPASGS